MTHSRISQDVDYRLPELSEAHLFCRQAGVREKRYLRSICRKGFSLIVCGCPHRCFAVFFCNKLATDVPEVIRAEVCRDERPVDYFFWLTKLTGQSFNEYLVCVDSVSCDYFPYYFLCFWQA